MNHIPRFTFTKYLILACFLAVPVYLNAQEIRATIKIINSKKEVVPFATVRIINGTDSMQYFTGDPL